MKYFVAGLELADLASAGAGARLAAGAVVDAAAVWELAEREGRVPGELLAELAREAGGPVVVDVAAAGAVENALKLASPGGPVVVRVPYGEEGRAAIRAGVAAGLRMAAVGCVTPALALQAAEAGAAWVSPVAGLPAAGAALDEVMTLIRKTVALLKSADVAAQVLVGPVRDASTLIDVAFAGAHAASAPAALLREIGKPLAPRVGAGRPVGR
jgi:transaldolase